MSKILLGRYGPFLLGHPFKLRISPEDIKSHIHVIGVSGCLHPDTPIFDPEDKTTKTVSQRFLLGNAFHVVALDEANRPIIARAEAPGQFTKERMYRVTFASGETVTVTGAHRIFVGNGYQEVRHLAHRIESGGGLPVLVPSISDSDLLASLSDAQHWTETAEGFQDGCHRLSHLYGQQPQSVKDSGQASSPSPGDVQRPGCALCGMGDLGNKYRCNPSGDVGHSSTRDSSCQRRYTTSSGGVSRCFEDDGTQFHISHQHGKLPALASVLSCRAELSVESSLVSSIDPVDEPLTCSCGYNATRSVDECPLSGQSPAMVIHADKAGIPPESSSLFLCSNHAYMHSNGITVHTASQVVDIQEVEEAVYYDFHVPIYENYWACGVFHHNSGKSRFLAGLYLSLIEQGLPATLLDPHGDLAELVLSTLVSRGYFRRPDAFDNLIYLDLPGAEHQSLYLPFNPLAQGLPPHTIAGNFKEAMHRAFPELKSGAATFDSLLPRAIKVLLANKLPLTQLERFFLEDSFRGKLLASYHEEHVTMFFRNAYELMRKTDQINYAGSVLRRAALLMDLPVLRYSLGAPTNAISFPDILEQGKSLIVNLALQDAEAARLWGCMLTVALEQAAKNRAFIPYEQRDKTHHVVIDEASRFIEQSGESMQTMLSETRKFGTFLVLAHQTYSQTSEWFRGSLQNVGMEVHFRQGREDAEYSAKILNRPDPEIIKHVVDDEKAIERTHPVFSSVPEQWEGYVQELQDLGRQKAVIRLPTGRKHHWQIWKKWGWKSVPVKVMNVPNPGTDARDLAEVEDEYVRRYFVPPGESEPPLVEGELFPALPLVVQPPPLRRLLPRR